MIDVRVAMGQIATLLQTIPSNLLIGYPDGEVPDQPPTPPNDPRVMGYWVLFSGAGTAGPARLAAVPLLDQVPFQVTVAGGTKDRVLNGVDLVRKKISGVVIPSGLISERSGFDPGTIRIDRNETPHRHFVPMPFLLEP